MKLSIQTVCVVFGVTLVHLFAITALTPLSGEWTETRPEIERPSELKADSPEDLADALPLVTDRPLPVVEDAVALPPRNPVDSAAENAVTAKSSESPKSTESSELLAVDPPGELHPFRPIPRS